MPAQLAFTDVTGGTSSVEAPNRILPNQVAQMVNCTIDKGLPRTRPGVIVMPLRGDAAEFVAENNVQGCIAYNPAMGQGGLTFGKDQTMLALASGGRKLVARIIGTEASAVGEIEDITNGLFTNSNLHLVWLNQWENHLLAQDGESNCFIWDAVNPARFSAGYNTTNKEASRVPNGGTVMLYSHARGSVVVNSRFVLTGDILHKSDLSSAANLLNFTEQSYWATGQYFLPPTHMGAITAAAVLPLRNTQHGHGEALFHCERGIFSIDLNIFPRSSWSTTQMTKIVHADEGATGPYALAIYNGDQVFRTCVGVQTLRSAAATNLEGDTTEPVSSEVDLWMQGDWQPYLRFCSVAIWRTNRRLLCTVNPMVAGRFRWHRGMLVRTYDTAPGAQGGSAAWEGLWTLPPQCSGITQFVVAEINRQERAFAWTRGSDEVTRLVEFSKTRRTDRLEDGTEKPIRCQVLTRQIDAGAWWQQREYSMGRLYLRHIAGTVRWAVWVRPYESGKWVAWQAGTVTSNLFDFASGDLAEGALPSTTIPLGTVPKTCGGESPIHQTRGLQALIRWEGCCTLEGIRVTHGNSDISKDDVLDRRLNLTLERITDTELDDFEYSERESATWIT